MRRRMSRQRPIVARMVRRVVMLRMRWRRMARVLHHAILVNAPGRRRRVLAIFVNGDDGGIIVPCRRMTKCNVVMVIVRGGIAEARGTR